jgi:hypothetical protein
MPFKIFVGQPYWMREEKSTFVKANDVKCQLRRYLSECPEAQQTVNKTFQRAELSLEV